MMKVIKTAIQQQWNVHYLDDMIDRAGKQMAEEIDFGVLSNLLVEHSGWSKVVLDTVGSNERAVDMNEWLHVECKKQWKHLGRTFVFESRDDAALFKLTWS